MNLFDLHCDTATALLAKRQGLLENNLHVSLKNAQYINRYAQVMAVWSHRDLNDAEAYSRFFEVISNLENEIELNSGYVGLAKSAKDISLLTSSNKSPLILAIEDARLLENDLNRLNTLHERGVRVLTLNWYGITCIGGAHDTNIGLSDFGVSVVNKCFDLGIIPDVSHSSFNGAKEVIELAKQAGKPIIASHSDSYSVNPHSRNLTDDDFRSIVSLGGLVGISLCPSHLSSSSSASVSDIVRHIEHYLSLGGENTLAIGADLDGTNLPLGFEGIVDIYKIADELQRLNFKNELIEKIYYANAFKFFTDNL